MSDGEAAGELKDADARIQATLSEARAALDSLIADASIRASIVRSASVLAAALTNRRRVFSCGNGGSMCDAMHFAEELSGRYRLNRPALAAVAISDPAHLTCVANDFGFDQVFARFLQAHAAAGDCLLAISTSGKSANVLEAARVARDASVTVIALTGRPGTPLGALADVEIATPSGPFADRVQELHIKVIHILVELLERQLFPALYP